MFSGRPLPLQPDLPLVRLLVHAQPPETLGAWVRGCVRRLPIYRLHQPRFRILASSDLGFLLARCDRVCVREGRRPVVLDAETLIQWRALQVATATPHLPGLHRLQALFPGIQVNADTVLVPLGVLSPEEVLASCLAEGLQVRGSRVVYSQHG